VGGKGGVPKESWLVRRTAGVQRERKRDKTLLNDRNVLHWRKIRRGGQIFKGTFHQVKKGSGIRIAVKEPIKLSI